MSIKSVSAAYAMGWNDWLDGKGQDDNPWTECSDAGHDWMCGAIDAEKLADEIGLAQMERAQ